MAMPNKLIAVDIFSSRVWVLILNSSWASSITKALETPSFRKSAEIKRHFYQGGRAETNRSRCHRVFACRIQFDTRREAASMQAIARVESQVQIHSDPISRMKPELNKANNSVAAECPTCHATTSFDAHDASVNLEL